MLNPQPGKRTPILVTGAERSGTTWAGRMLAASGEAIYVGESFNVIDRRIWMQPAVEHWCPYICAENEDRYLPAIENLLRFRFPVWAALRSLPREKKPKNLLLDGLGFFRGRLLDKRLLMKDPSAIFAAPWLTTRLGVQVVITVRHPLAVVSSRQRLSWPIRLGDWFDQPLLVRDLLDPYVDEIRRLLEESRSGKADLVDLAAWYWRVLYQIAAHYQREHPQFVVVRHEDLSLHPQETFQTIYSRLELNFNPRALKEILASTAAGNPAEVSLEHPYATRLDSRANLENWKHRLSAGEIERVRRITEDVCALFYDEQDWP